MSTSLMEALLIGSIGVITGGILLSIRHKLHYGLYSNKLFNLSLGMILMGVGGGLISYYTSIGPEKNTVIRSKVSGSVGAVEGEAAPVRTLEFTVEHPDVAHELSIKPVDPLIKNSFDVEIQVTIVDPAHEEIFSVRQYFEPQMDARSEAMVERWRFIDTTFVPRYNGKYVIWIVPITIGIPEIEVWIRDPRKRDGQRTFSWR